ncbi:MAG: branched-chain amino acid ABC transporter permease [Syntrophomonadaceae bacterium]|jgi:branched-chain amino acid transport system permease protein
MFPIRLAGKSLLISLVVITLLLLPLGIPPYGITFMTQVFIFALFAVSLDILIGYLNLMSFNHATFFGVGAYCVAILSSNNEYNFWLMLVIGMVVPMLVAAFMGIIVLRSSGAYFLLITLAFNQMVYAIAWKWRSFTGGDDGLPGIARPDIGLNLSMWNQEYFYYLVLVIFMVMFALIWKLVHSFRGRLLVGIRESEIRMQALGYNTAAIKWLTYVLAAGVAGLAGVLFVYFNGFISPQELNWTMSGLVILMVIIGGAGTLAGPVLGAAIILFLQQSVSSYTEQWPLVMGIIFIICVLYARDGCYGILLKFIKKVMASYENSGGQKSK